MSPGKTLWIWEHLPKNVEDNKSWLKEGDAVENVHRLQMSGHQPGSFAQINSGARFPHTVSHDLDLLDVIGKLAQPGCQIKIVQAVAENISGLISASKLASQLKLAGLIGVQAPTFLNLNDEQLEEISSILKIQSNESLKVAEIQCTYPNFANGSSTALSFAHKLKKKQPEKKVWSLADMEDDDVDLIDEDELLDDEDLAKPDQASLRVCGTTGKRKACKDCSCGLAEELSGGGEIPKKSFTSSCGSCYLGDAFRCASCPYLGMPAFKPGEKIQLSERQLKADQ